MHTIIRSWKKTHHKSHRRGGSRYNLIVLSRAYELTPEGAPPQNFRYGHVTDHCRINHVTFIRMVIPDQHSQVSAFARVSYELFHGEKSTGR